MLCRPGGDIDLVRRLARTVVALLDVLLASGLELYECCRFSDGGDMVDGVSGDRLRVVDVAMVMSQLTAGFRVVTVFGRNTY